MWLGEEDSRQRGQVQGPGEGMYLVYWRNSKGGQCAQHGLGEGGGNRRSSGCRSPRPCRPQKDFRFYCIK